MDKMYRNVASGWSCRVYVSGLFGIDCSGVIPSSPTKPRTSGSSSPSLLKRDEIQTHFQDFERQTTPLVTSPSHQGAILVFPIIHLDKKPNENPSVVVYPSS